MRITWTGVAAVLAAATLGAAEAPVGSVRGGPEVSVDGSRLHGNGTVFRESLVETGGAPAVVAVVQGAVAELGPQTRGRIYQDKLTLLAGLARVSGTSPYSIQSASVTVRPAAGAVVEVATNATDTRVRISRGSAEVRNAGGMLVAMLPPGSSVRFSHADGNPGVARLTGVVRKSGSHYLLRDETTRVSVELRGSGLQKLVGTRVEVRGHTVSGTVPAKGATQVVAVDQARSVGLAAASAGGRAAPAAIASGVGKGTLAVLGGLTAAATVGTLYAADAVSGDDEPSASIP